MKYFFARKTIFVWVSFVLAAAGLATAANRGSETSPTSSPTTKPTDLVEKNFNQLDDPPAFNPDLEFLYNTIYQSPTKTTLIGRSGSLYINLQREIDRAIEDRNKERELATAQSELEQKLGQLKVLQDQLAKDVDKRADSNTSLAHLITLYESISPEKVAGLLEKMPFTVSVAIMRKMAPKKSSQVLAAMENPLAIEISRRMIRSYTEIQQGGRQ